MVSLALLPNLLLCFGFLGLVVAETRPEPFRFDEIDLEFLDQIKHTQVCHCIEF